MSTEVRLSLDWELWVVEQLLFTAKKADISILLAEQGVPLEVARARVEEIVASRGFARLQARLSEATLAARLQRLGNQLIPRVDGVPIRDTIDRDTLLREHWMLSRPVLLTDVMDGCRAMDWTIASLAERFLDATVEVNIDRTDAERPSQTERWVTEMPFPDWIEQVLHEPGNAQYVVSRNGLLSRPGFRALWDDLDPLPDILVPPEPPKGVSLWLGPAGTVTPPHFDPHNVLLVQVEGEKRVRLAPRVRALLADQLDGYYLDGTLDDIFPDDEVLSVELKAGQALFVPVGWFHEVTALEPSLTLSFLCFPWKNHFHGLGPPGSDDRR